MNLKSAIYFYVFLSLILPGHLYAQIDAPITDLNALANPEPEKTVHVKTAKVLLADYTLIKKDFEETRKMSNAEIDKWIIANFAYISEHQIKQNEVNTPISVDENNTRVGYRPKGYGRALVFQTRKGLIDAKGVGALKPKQASHRNGIFTTGESLREFVYEKMAERILDHYHKNFQPEKKYNTIGTYWAIDWGFDVIHNNGQTAPAGGVFRQAHDRYGDPNSDTYNFLPAKDALAIEKILRTYGLSSAGVGKVGDFEMADLQGTKLCDIVDFGSFLTFKDFNSDLGFITDIDLELQLKKDSKDFVHPNEDIRLPFNIWGYLDGTDPHPKNDIPRRVLDEAAVQLRANKMTRRELEQRIDEFFFQPVERKWTAYQQATLIKIMHYCSIHSRRVDSNKPDKPVSSDPSPRSQSRDAK